MTIKVERERYQVIEFRFAGNDRPVRGLRCVTLSQAKAHCEDPETSSRTCTKSHLRAKTKQYGAWFHGYQRI